ncbi:MAG: 3-methyl-2-oxobutanoate hydroxymethyltransferase [Phycisphaerales bacterium]|nr:3-methyl-2-oxobutanoate hydroxymethyltransferase [Phycisphaerales bacterium]
MNEELSDTTKRAAPVTLRTLLKMVRGGEKFACLTCYDATTARWLQEAGMHMLLVGDTAGEVILGFPNTIHTPLEFLIALTAGVKRGAPATLVMADMPFMSYQADDAQAIRNAGRFLTEGLADLVKLEVDRSFAPLVAKMSRAGIPVVAHIGSRPQHAKMHGGYYAAGKSAVTAIELLDDARAMAEAGATLLLVEAAPAEVTAQIVRESTLPVIGCGAGSACHGQVVVLQDLLGMSAWQPAFALPTVQIGRQIADAAQHWMNLVASGNLGEHSYVMNNSERAAFQVALAARAAAAAEPNRS